MMPPETAFWIVAALAALAGLFITSRATLAGWNGWLALRRLEIERRRDPGAPSPGTRIELADLKERIRKLEAIAAGVDI